MELYDSPLGQKVRYRKLHARSGKHPGSGWSILRAVHESTRFIAAGSSVSTRGPRRHSADGELSGGLGKPALVFAIWCSVRIQ